MRNMRCAKVEAVAALDAATIGVFAFVGKDGRPRACPVTPYVDVDEAVVSSTLAFTAKVTAVRRDPRVALLAGGREVVGHATVDIDLTSTTFDERIRAQELRKYPPARQLLAIPGHRRLLWWYVGRSTIRIPLADCRAVVGSDRITLTVIDGDGLRIVPLDPATDTSASEIPVPIDIDGAACVLAHDEDPQMSDLRQLSLRGHIADGRFHVEHRNGSLSPTNPSTLDQLRTVRFLARQARQNRALFECWHRPADPARSQS